LVKADFTGAWLFEDVDADAPLGLRAAGLVLGTCCAGASVFFSLVFFVIRPPLFRQVISAAFASAVVKCLPHLVSVLLTAKKNGETKTAKRNSFVSPSDRHQTPTRV
jgi:hypothetical protein